ncbi:MAG: glycerophosphodiester phosphodiesterase family protein, partial [Ilumatobacteraceae bacterium]
MKFGLDDWCHYTQKILAVPHFRAAGETFEERVEWVNESGLGVIGTPDDAIRQIERLEKQSNGGFGAYLMMAHEWANPRATHDHYELFARYVKPGSRAWPVDRSPPNIGRSASGRRSGTGAVGYPRPTMKLRLAPLAATVLLATACSGTPDDTASEAGTAPATSTPATSTPATSAPASSVPSSTTTATATTTEAPAARAVDVVPRPEASTVADLLALARPLVIAHAGGDFEAPHSTMYAFTLAALAGTDVLEMDVMTTADDVLVVHHDDTVDRTTETTGAVRDLTYDQLVELDNAHWFVEGTWSDQSRPDDEYLLRGVRTGARPAPEGFGPDDFRIETFRSVAESFPNHVLDVEIKVQSTPEGEPDLERAVRTARLLADEIADLGRGEAVIVVSFDVDV